MRDIQIPRWNECEIAESTTKLGEGIRWHTRASELNNTKVTKVGGRKNNTRKTRGQTPPKILEYMQQTELDISILLREKKIRTTCSSDSEVNIFIRRGAWIPVMSPNISPLLFSPFFVCFYFFDLVIKVWI